MSTGASSGSLTTQYFGEKFDAAKVETYFVYTFNIFPPSSVRNNTNATLHLEVEKVSMEALSSGRDVLIVAETKVERSHSSFNLTSPTGQWAMDFYSVEFGREVLLADIMKQTLQTMPGFRVTWHYSGMEVEPVANIGYLSTMAFIRNDSNIIKK